MRCGAARRAVALGASGEAPAAAARALERHLAGCAACRGFAAAAAPDLGDFRGPTPLATADLARLRGAVLRQLRSEGRRVPRAVPGWQWAAATLAGVALVATAFALARWAWSRPVPQVAAQSPPAATPAAAPAPGPAAPVATAPPAPPPAAVVTAAAPPGPPRRTGRAPATPLTREAASGSALARVAPDLAAPAPPLRIELRTADPDVRIIWLANQPYPPESASALEEDP